MKSPTPQTNLESLCFAKNTLPVRAELASVPVTSITPPIPHNQKDGGNISTNATQMTIVVASQICIARFFIVKSSFIRQLPYEAVPKDAATVYLRPKAIRTFLASLVAIVINSPCTGIYFRCGFRISRSIISDRSKYTSAIAPSGAPSKKAQQAYQISYPS